MLEILQFYVSGFWVWAGITVGIYVTGMMVVTVFSSLVLTFWGRGK